MCVRLRYRFRELETKATCIFDKNMHKNRPHSKMGMYGDKGTIEFPWGKQSRINIDTLRG
jgi:hypothetical protein